MDSVYDWDGSVEKPGVEEDELNLAKSQNLQPNSSMRHQTIHRKSLHENAENHHHVADINSFDQLPNYLNQSSDIYNKDNFHKNFNNQSKFDSGERGNTELSQSHGSSFGESGQNHFPGDDSALRLREMESRNQAEISQLELFINQQAYDKESSDFKSSLVDEQQLDLFINNFTNSQNSINNSTNVSGQIANQQGFGGTNHQLNERNQQSSMYDDLSLNADQSFVVLQNPLNLPAPNSKTGTHIDSMHNINGPKPVVLTKPLYYQKNQLLLNIPAPSVVKSHTLQKVNPGVTHTSTLLEKKINGIPPFSRVESTILNSLLESVILGQPGQNQKILPVMKTIGPHVSIPSLDSQGIKSNRLMNNTPSGPMVSQAPDMRLQSQSTGPVLQNTNEFGQDQITQRSEAPQVDQTEFTKQNRIIPNVPKINSESPVASQTNVMGANTNSADPVQLQKDYGGTGASLAVHSQHHVPDNSIPPQMEPPLSRAGVNHTVSPQILLKDLDFLKIIGGRDHSQVPQAKDLDSSTTTGSTTQARKPQVRQPQRSSARDQSKASSSSFSSKVPQLSLPPQLSLKSFNSADKIINSGAPTFSSQSSLAQSENNHSSQIPQLTTSQTSNISIPQPPKPHYDPPQVILLIPEKVELLTKLFPRNIDEFSKHIFEILTLVNDDKLDEQDELPRVVTKFNSLIGEFLKYVNFQNPIKSQIYVIIQMNFDLFIKTITYYKKLDLATKTVRFLTNLLMHCNYWEIYNLLQWKPAIYHFLQLIQFDINDCYARFIHDYQSYNYKKIRQPNALPRKPIRRRFYGRSTENYYDDDDDSDDDSDIVSDDESDRDDLNEDSAKIKRSSRDSPKRRRRRSARSNPRKAVKKLSNSSLSSAMKSSNYDPDVIHECQLPSAEEPHKLCLRRFSRKYDLVRHQETVHSNKKKLFKCYVCIRLNPKVGPRIFTRHDTLAKHIRVNHKISGKEAKAEVSYSKKNAEIVEEGDITVHVGRRKTKVDFELRAHMENRRGDGIEVDDDMCDDMDSGDEIVTYNKKS